MKVLRQGDVILIPTTKRPSATAQLVIDRGRTILAYGEVTGHAHEVVTVAPGEVPVDDDVPAQQLFQEPDGSRLLVCRVPCALTHQEHSTIALDATTYEVRKQTEWSLDQARQVAD
jgi:hypothetical protein